MKPLPNFIKNNGISPTTIASSAPNNPPSYVILSSSQFPLMGTQSSSTQNTLTSAPVSASNQALNNVTAYSSTTTQPPSVTDTATHSSNCNNGLCNYSILLYIAGAAVATAIIYFKMKE